MDGVISGTSGPFSHDGHPAGSPLMGHGLGSRRIHERSVRPERESCEPPADVVGRTAIVAGRCERQKRERDWLVAVKP